MFLIYIALLSEESEEQSYGRAGSQPLQWTAVLIGELECPAPRPQHYFPREILATEQEAVVQFEEEETVREAVLNPPSLCLPSSED